MVEIDLAGTPEQIARGAHLANTVCAGCHTVNDEIPLSSGKDILEDVPMPLGSFTPPNLTPGMLPLKDLPVPGPVVPVSIGPTVEYGRYIANFIGCSECHGEDLSAAPGDSLPKGRP